MTFIRGSINLGIRELIKQAVIEAGFYRYEDTSDLTDIKLLRYVSSAGKEEWFDFLIKNGDFFDQKGRIRKEFAGQFDECIIFAVSGGHVSVARKLYTLGARIKYYLTDRLILAIMNNRHELAELCFEMGAKLRVKYQFIECLKIADDKMVSIIEKHRENVVFMLINDSPKVVTELLEKRKKRKK